MVRICGLHWRVCVTELALQFPVRPALCWVVHVVLLAGNGAALAVLSMQGHLVHCALVCLHLSVMLVPVMFCDAMQPALAQGLTANDGHQGALFGPSTRYSSSGSCRVRLCTFCASCGRTRRVLGVMQPRSIVLGLLPMCWYLRGDRQQLHSVRTALRLGVGGCVVAGGAPHRAIAEWHSNPAPPGN